MTPTDRDQATRDRLAAVAREILHDLCTNAAVYHESLIVKRVADLVREGQADALETAAEGRRSPRPAHRGGDVVTGPDSGGEGRRIEPTDAERRQAHRIWNDALCNSEVPGWKRDDLLAQALADQRRKGRCKDSGGPYEGCHWTCQTACTPAPTVPDNAGLREAIAAALFGFVEFDDHMPAVAAILARPEVAALLAERDKAEAQVAAVRKLHGPERYHCGQYWVIDRCETWRALGDA